MLSFCELFVFVIVLCICFAVLLGCFVFVWLVSLCLLFYLLLVQFLLVFVGLSRGLVVVLPCRVICHDS